MIHYVGHFGDINALRCLIKFGFDLRRSDKFGQTIVHYAARAGRLGILKVLTKYEHMEPEFDKRNIYGVPPALYALTNQKIYSFIFLHLKVGCPLSEDLAKYAVKEIMKLEVPCMNLLTLLCQIGDLKKTMALTILIEAIQYGNMEALRVGLCFATLEILS